MTIQELYEKWKSWAEVARQINHSVTGIKFWRERGSIPYNAQLAIQCKTKGMFKARKEDDKPPKKEAGDDAS